MPITAEELVPPLLRDQELWPKATAMMQHILDNFESRLADTKEKFRDSSRVSNDAIKETISELGLDYISNVLDTFTDIEFDALLDLVSAIALKKGHKDGIELVLSLLDVEFTITEWWEQGGDPDELTYDIDIIRIPADSVFDIAETKDKIQVFLRNYVLPELRAFNLFFAFDTPITHGLLGGGFYTQSLTGSVLRRIPEKQLGGSEATSWSELGSTGFSEPLYDIAESQDGVLVAVGAGGTVLRSTDSGSTWSPDTIGSEDLHVITYGAGIFVAASETNIYRSLDGGQTWNDVTPSGYVGRRWDGDWNTDLNQFLLAGDSEPSITLNNVSGTFSVGEEVRGDDWILLDRVGNTSNFSYYYLEEKDWIIGGGKNTIRLTKDDGLDWGTIFVTNGSILGLASKGDRIVGVGSDGPNPFIVYSSSIDDLSFGSWTRIPGPSGSHAINDLIYVSTLGLYVAVGDGVGSTQSVMTSSDGVNWSPQGPTGAQLQAVAWSESLGLLVAVASSGDVYSSPDGTSWSLEDTLADSLDDIIWDGSQFFVVGGNGVGYTSSDGQTWSSSFTIDPGGNSANSVITYTGTTYNVFNKQSEVFVSDDLSTWVRDDLPNPGVQIDSSTYINGVLILGGLDISGEDVFYYKPVFTVDSIISSGGGVTEILANDSSANFYRDTVSLETGDVTGPSGFTGFSSGATGDLDTIGTTDQYLFISEDRGETWQAVDLASVEYGLRNVRWSREEGYYVSGTRMNGVLKSTDGKSWVVHSISSSDEPSGVDWDRINKKWVMGIRNKFYVLESLDGEYWYGVDTSNSIGLVARSPRFRSWALDGQTNIQTSLQGISWSPTVVPDYFPTRIRWAKIREEFLSTSFNGKIFRGAQ